jgi:hypothetical protein
MVYLGVDLHRKVSHLVALDDAGQVVLSRRLAHDPAEFRRAFGELEPEPIEAVFEATSGWCWFADLLADAGWPRIRLVRRPFQFLFIERSPRDGLAAVRSAGPAREAQTYGPQPGRLDRAEPLARPPRVRRKQGCTRREGSS